MGKGAPFGSPVQLGPPTGRAMYVPWTKACCWGWRLNLRRSRLSSSASMVANRGRAVAVAIGLCPALPCGAIALLLLRGLFDTPDPAARQLISAAHQMSLCCRLPLCCVLMHGTAFSCPIGRCCRLASPIAPPPSGRGGRARLPLQMAGTAEPTAAQAFAYVEGCSGARPLQPWMAVAAGRPEGLGGRSCCWLWARCGQLDLLAGVPPFP